jgi:hypothetical protein
MRGLILVSARLGFCPWPFAQVQPGPTAVRIDEFDAGGNTIGTIWQIVNRLPNLTRDWSAPLIVDIFRQRF